MSKQPELPSNEYEGSFLGRQISFGDHAKRWRIKDICYREEPRSAQNIRFFLFVGTRLKMKENGRLTIASFIPDDITGEVVGEEVAIYLNKEKTLAVWVPLADTSPTITD